MPHGPAPKRRGILWLVAAVGLTAGLGLAAEMSRDDRAAQAREQENDHATREELLGLGWVPLEDAAARDLAVERGVEMMVAGRAFQLPAGNGPISASAPDAGAAERASAIVHEELRRFPEGFVAAAGLWRVVFCEGLREGNDVIPSLPNYRHTLLLDVRAEPAYLRRLVHHEVFHFVDFADDGIVLADRRWEALNRTGFAYGYGGRDMRSPDATPMREDLPGFVSLYATSALEEDKAEIFAFMMARPDAMRRLAARDDVIAAKVAYVSSVVAALSPNVDESFWADQH